MLTMMMAATLLSGGLRAPVAAEPPLHCRIEVAKGGKAKKCKVKVPARREVRRCTDADRQASHCDASGIYAAWVVSQGPGRCRISAKKTDWTSVVVAKLSKKPEAPSSCDLYVELR